ncbi:MAG: J domain-containing protein [Pseudobdellovibrionaceae bacterium]
MNPNVHHVLGGVECAPIWPDIKKKCEDLKTEARSCSSPAERKKRFEELVEKTKQAIPMIEDLIQAHHACLQKFSAPEKNRVRNGPQLSKTALENIQKSCDPIAKAIEIKKNEVPWVRGKKFQETAIKKKPQPRYGIFKTEYDLSDATIANSIRQQMDFNRATLADSYKKNLEAFRCLSETSNRSQTCDFEKLRTRLQRLPVFQEQNPNSTSAAGREAQTYLDAESCILERHEDRHQTKEVVDDAFVEASITAVTFGGGRVFQALSALNKAGKATRLGMVAESGLVGANAGLASAVTLKAIEKCEGKKKSLIDLEKKANLANETVCASKDSALSQAQEAEANCTIEALTSIASVAPFIAAIPSLQRVITGLKEGAGANRAQKLQEFIKTVKTSGKQNRDLDFASTLTLEERYQVAEAITGKPLTGAQKLALKQVHEKGGYDFDPNSPLTRERDEVLQKGGFTARESAILRGNGIAGQWEDTLRSGFTGQTASVPRSNGSRSKATITNVEEYDQYGNAKSVRVEWIEGDNLLSKTVDIDKIHIDYNLGQKVYFPRSDGSFTQAEINGVKVDPRTGEKTYLMRWSEGGYTKSKEVDADEVSHLKPQAKAQANNSQSAGQQQGQQQNQYSERFPGREPPPNQRNPAPSSFQEAERVVPRENNSINFAADRAEMARIVESNNRVHSYNDIQRALNIPGNPSREQIKLEVRKRLQKYHPDHNPEYKSVSQETSKVLNDMLGYIRQAERNPGANP